MSFWIEAGCYYKALAMVMISCKSASRIFPMALCTGCIKFRQNGAGWFADRDLEKLRVLNLLEAFEREPPPGKGAKRPAKSTASPSVKSVPVERLHQMAFQEPQAARPNGASMPDFMMTSLRSSRTCTGLARRDDNGKARARSEIATSCFECKSPLVLCSGDLGP